MDLIVKQVPTYLLIGDGRAARHFQHYFALLRIPFATWSRKSDSLEILQQRITEASHILILIRDQAIDPFIREFLPNTRATCIHFSGSLVSEGAYGAHPLITFNESLYGLAEYLTVPFIVDHHAPDFAELLPGLPNANFRLNTDLKAKYHALCVLSGNFSCMLWKKLFHHLQTEFNLPESIAHPYLFRQMQNLAENSKTALTGPLVRGDTATIEKNLAALDQDPFQALYESFLICYQQSRGIL